MYGLLSRSEGLRAVGRGDVVPVAGGDIVAVAGSIVDKVDVLAHIDDHHACRVDLDVEVRRCDRLDTGADATGRRACGHENGDTEGPPSTAPHQAGHDDAREAAELGLQLRQALRHHPPFLSPATSMTAEAQV